MSGPGFNSTPQFDKAEYMGESGGERCSACNQPIPDHYYRVNGAMVCPTCVQDLRSSLPGDTHAAFMRALLFGCGAAILGLILYSAFGIMTGLVIGYLSLGVGYLVGKAMMAGSRGIGGRRYQISAVLLTYAAVSMSAIPIDIDLMSKERAARHEQAAQQKRAADQQRAQMENEQKQFEQEFGKQYTSQPPKASGDASAPAQAAPTDQTAAELQPAPVKKAAPRQSVAAAVGYLAVLGLASPFLELEDPLHGAIGLIILLVGVRIAWQLTAAKIPEVTGPYRNSSPNPPASS